MCQLYEKMTKWQASLVELGGQECVEGELLGRKIMKLAPMGLRVNS